ncbi:sensor histidine kinase [Effusibacillus consociatus]|uniref:histidine kinase n=1 Tax=Effusibacillus consociatus TaxID=1117041 RepID=A0ABV9Q2F1_9BACL
MKSSIGKKLVLTYLVLIGVTLAVSGVLFNAFIKNYMVEEAKSSLRTEAGHLIELMGADQAAVIDPIKKRVITKIALSTIESDYFIVQKSNQQVIASSSKDIVKLNRSPFPVSEVYEGRGIEGEAQVKGKDIVYVALPMDLGKGSQVTHAVVLFTELQHIRSATREVVMLLIKGFVITAIVMLIVAYIMMRSLTRPLQNLRQAVMRLMNRDFTPPQIVKTGDELEELSKAFSDMTVALKKYDEGQRRFLQNASHELKTPLMAIQGYAEGIRDGIFRGADAEKGLDAISTESKRLKKMVDELIYLSKLETLEGMFDPQPVDLKLILQESIDRVKSLARQKGVQIDLHGDLDKRLMLDPDKMIQAFINLIGNGIRHANSQVRVELASFDSVVRITVEDDGPGLREGDKERIFERFFRGKDGDTGLGLAITRAIIEKSGGIIKADNGTNGGAVFTVEFRAKK